MQRLIDRIIIRLYLTPGSTENGNVINFWYEQRIQDSGAYTNATNVPYRFVPCMCAGLAYYLSLKYAPEKTQNLKLLYEDELSRALEEDGSSTSTYISPKTYYPTTIIIYQKENMHYLFLTIRISFSHREMVREWNGARVHTSEFEPKQPQLDPKPYTADPQGLPHPRPARVEPATVDFLNDNPFTTIGSSTLSQ